MRDVNTNWGNVNTNWGNLQEEIIGLEYLPFLKLNVLLKVVFWSIVVVPAVVAGVVVMSCVVVGGCVVVAAGEGEEEHEKGQGRRGNLQSMLG